MRRKILGSVIFLAAFLLFESPSVFSQDFKAENGAIVNYPSESYYTKGIVVGVFNLAVGCDSAAIDFGAGGLWMYDTSFHQLTTSNPDWMFSAKFVEGESLVIAFPGAGLWVWQYGAGYPGTFTQITTSIPTQAFATDEDYDGRDELQVAFSSGVYGYDWDSKTWYQYTNIAPTYYGLRSDFWVAGYEEGVWSFTTYGVWCFYGQSSSYNTQLTKTLTFRDDHVSANFDSSLDDEELLYNFSTLGTWVYDGSAWHQLTSSGPSRATKAMFVSGGVQNWVAVINWPIASGIWTWDHQGSYPGVFTCLTTSNPETDGFIEAWDPNGFGEGGTAAAGNQELAIDFGTLGLWKYQGGAFTQLTSSNPYYFVPADRGGGIKEYLFVKFSSGVWLYDGWTGSWSHLTTSVPD